MGVFSSRKISEKTSVHSEQEGSNHRSLRNAIVNVKHTSDKCGREGMKLSTEDDQ